MRKPLGLQKLAKDLLGIKELDIVLSHTLAETKNIRQQSTLAQVAFPGASANCFERETKAFFSTTLTPHALEGLKAKVGALARTQNSCAIFEKVKAAPGFP